MYFNPHSYLQVSHININNYIFCSGSFAVLRNISLMLYCLQSYSLQLHEQEFIVIKIVYCFFFPFGQWRHMYGSKTFSFSIRVQWGGESQRNNCVCNIVTPSPPTPSLNPRTMMLPYIIAKPVSDPPSPSV